MSGLRKNLHEWAQGHGDQVAQTLAVNERGVRAAIARRRRNRGLAKAATAAAAIVGIAALASAFPGVNEAPPTDHLPRHLSELVCGDPWVVDAGTTSFVEEPDYYFSAPQGDWVLTDDNGDTHTDFAGFTAGLGTVSWQGDIEVRHRVIVRARVVAVKGGAIVGVTEDQYARPGDGGVAALFANAPRPGPCGDTTAGGSSGKVTYHLVMQVQSVDDGAKTIATIVDPGGAKTVAIDGVEAWLTAQADPSATPSEPAGDEYQAFVVPRPTEASCTPYQDLIAAGNPRSAAMNYNVTIPGMQPLGTILGDGGPVIASDSSQVGAWFADLDSWLVLEAGSNSTRPLAWNPDFIELAPSDTAPRPSAQLECAVTFQYEPPSGAVYLIIDGVDTAAIDAAYHRSLDYDVEAMQTWIYLGEADTTNDLG